MIAQLALPLARNSDPVSSREAAESVKPGNSALVNAIREAVRDGELLLGAVTAFQIARRVEEMFPGRWDEGSIRTACKRAGLVAVDTEGRSPRGSRCLRFTLGRV